MKPRTCSHSLKKDTPVKIIQHRKIRHGGTLKSVTLSREADGAYYASMLYEYPAGSLSHYCTIDENKAIGLDMSLEHLYADSNGGITDYPRFYRTMEAVLAREQAKRSHMVKDSNNYNKQSQVIAKLYATIKHQRSDFLHKLSTDLVRHYDIICIEDLDMKAMSQGLSLGKSVGDAGWGMFIAMLGYKCKKYGKRLIKVDRWYASSKTCSYCGSVNKELQLSDRTYVCPACGFIIDRDWQAAMNILNEGLRIYGEAAA